VEFFLGILLFLGVGAFLTLESLLVGTLFLTWDLLLVEFHMESWISNAFRFQPYRHKHTRGIYMSGNMKLGGMPWSSHNNSHSVTISHFPFL
jgi:hypothetical protein